MRLISRHWLPSLRKSVIHTHINGYSILVLANEDVGRCIHFEHSYESPETNYLQKIIYPHSICVDVGANIGYFTMLMARGAPVGKVYAFEPIPLNAALLRASAELNGFDNIEIIESAVGEFDGQVELSQSVDSAYSSIHDTARKAVERVIRVPITKLDSFVSERLVRSIDILKIDVEGAEGLVLMGSKNIFGDEVLRPRVVLMELFDANLAPYGMSSLAIIETMNAYGYTPFFSNNEGNLVPFREEALNNFYNVLFLAQEST